MIRKSKAGLLADVDDLSKLEEIAEEEGSYKFFNGLIRLSADEFKKLIKLAYRSGTLEVEFCRSLVFNRGLTSYNFDASNVGRGIKVYPVNKEIPSFLKDDDKVFDYGAAVVEFFDYSATGSTWGVCHPKTEFRRREEVKLQ